MNNTIYNYTMNITFCCDKMWKRTEVSFMWSFWKFLQILKILTKDTNLTDFEAWEIKFQRC